MSAHIKDNKNGITSDPNQISNILCYVFTNVGTDYANAIPLLKESVSK